MFATLINCPFLQTPAEESSSAVRGPEASSDNATGPAFRSRRIAPIVSF
jgi:hypothetical protein